MSDLLERIRSALHDHYAIDGEIGQGGAAVVYRAEDRKHHRLVAIKVLRPEVAAEVGADRFVREVATIAQLNHPHILALLDSGEADGLPYFVTPYMSGETLKERLAREGQLHLDEALEITRDISSALAYAHSLGIVHRDIKPGNILLSGGHAVLADFGVARAISAAIEGDEERPGELFGTPLYMSPEQFTGSARLDRRSDLYSLGCVFYEMLAGAPPFNGSTPELLRVQHLTEPPPSLRGLNRDIPPEVDEVIRRLLAKTPADRFVTAQQLEDGLPVVPRPSPRGLRMPVASQKRQRRRIIAVATAVAALAATAWALTRPEPADPGMIAVMSSEGELAGQDSRFVLAVREELAHWNGLQVAEANAILEEVKPGTAPASFRDLAIVAGKIDASRLLRLESRAAGDSLSFSLALHDLRSRKDTVIASESFKCATTGHACDDALARGARRLLIAGTGYATDLPAGTRNLTAYTDYARGMVAFGAWQLGTADSLFSLAVTADPAYAEAHLSLAEVRWWRNRPAAGWMRQATAALAVGSNLSEAAASRARALLALAEKRFPAACEEFDAQLARDTLDFTAWFGRGECLRRDPVVVRDPRSPSGWRFRSSVHDAIRSYQRSLGLAPAIHRSFGARAYERVADLFYVDEYQVRSGVIEMDGRATDSIAFAAWPDLQADTVAFVPWPFREVMDFKRHTRAANQFRALLRNRSAVAAITAEWVGKLPESPAAHLARAEALESLREGGQEGGWRETLAYLATAQKLAPNDAEIAMAAAVAEVRVRLKSEDHANARKVADSILRTTTVPDTATARILASIAALTGRIETAVSLVREGARDHVRYGPQGQRYQLATPLSEAGLALLVYSSFAAPADSVAALEDRVEQLVGGYVTPPEMAAVRATLLERPAALAFPQLGRRPAHAIPPQNQLLLTAQQLFLQGRHAELASMLSEHSVMPDAGWRRSSVNVDAVYVDANLRLALGDTATAISEIGHSLSALAGYGRDLLWNDMEGSLPQMATLPRLMALRAELAARDHDLVTSRRWAAAVITLWSDADPALQPLVARMRELVAAAPPR